LFSLILCAIPEAQRTMAFQNFLTTCGLTPAEWEQKFKTAGFSTVSSLLELVTDWDKNPEKKSLYNALCTDQIGLSGLQSLKLLNALKKRLKPAPGAAPLEVEMGEQKVGDADGEGDTVEEVTSKGGADQGCIDLAFLLDTTGSMGSYISSAQQNIRNIVQKATADKDVSDVRFALVSYKDYNTGDNKKLVSRWTPNGVTSGSCTSPSTTPAADDDSEETATPAPALMESLTNMFSWGSSSKAPKAKKARRPLPSRRPTAPRSGSGNGFEDGTAARIYDFTADVEQMQQFVDSQRATGGGDGPEAVATALDCCENLAWRPNAAKIAILIADAPPHGVEPSGDNFPDGDPIGRDALSIARALADKDITLYTVACEPSVTNSFSFCRDFMAGVAEIGGGMLVPLANAKLLTDMVLASCKEGADLDKIQGEVEAELKKLKAANPDATQETLAEMCSTNLASRGVTSYQVADTSNAYGAFDTTNRDLLAAEGATLSSVRKQWKKTAAPANWDSGMKSQRIASTVASFSARQCGRMMKKKARKWGY